MAVARRPAGHRLASPKITAAFVALAGATLIAYSPAIRAPFIFDDATAIEHNATITTLWPLSVPLHPPRDSPVAGRPVTNYSLALNYAINDLRGMDQRANPDGPDATVSYHLLNLALHIMSGLFLLGIVRRTLSSGRFGAEWVQRADAIAISISAVWLLHPIQTEAVDYLAQRSELLVAWCYLAVLYCSLRAWDAATTAHRAWWYLVGGVACLLGMASKEVMVSAPLMVILYDRAFRADSWAALRGRRWYYAALMATLALAVVLISGNPRPGSAGFHVRMTWDQYLISQGWAIPHYLRLIFWPHRLTLDYGEQPVAPSLGVPGLLLLAGLGFGTVWAWIHANRWGWLGFLGAWFFCILAPSSSIVPIATEVAAERRIYLPLAAVLVVVAVGGAALLRRWSGQGMLARRGIVARRCGAAVFLALLALLTFRRSQLYANPEAIWRDAAETRPEDARAWNNLAQIVADLPVPRTAEADTLFRTAIRADSLYVPALYNVALDAIASRDFATAERMLRRILTVDPTDHDALAHLGAILLAEGDATSAIPLLEQVADHPPDAQLLVILGVAYKGSGRVADAADAFRRALRVDPANVAAQDALARLGP